MAGISPPPVEWIAAEGRWWVIRIVFPVVVIAALLVFLYAEWGVNPSWTGANPIIADWCILGVVALEFFLLYAVPSVRRIGISPLCLVVDIGIKKFTYSWTDVNSITRTRTNRFRWNQVSSVSRTRISVGSGLFMNWFTLSPQQGDRLAQFLRIP